MTKLRLKKGITQRQVAEAIGVTVQTVSNWETRYRVPKFEVWQILALCRLFDCTLEEMANEFKNS